MTGSALVPVFIPVVLVALAGWLALVYYAAAHPGYRTRKTVSEPGAAHADAAAEAARPGGKAGEERERTPATRRVA